MLNLDEAHEKLQEIQREINENISNIESEEDAKLQIINRILIECLNWKFSDIKAETHHENGFSDYILSVNQNPALLIEAKRIGVIEIDTAEKNRVRHLKLSGSSLKRSIKGIEQAVSYALPNGFNMAVLTDGLKWIIFKTFVSGANFKTKEAIVFPSIDAVVSDFSNFFDLLSKRKIETKTYNYIFNEIHHGRLLRTQKLIAPIEKNAIKIVQKSELAFDLENVFSNFFSRLTGDNDEDLLIECFVETRESRIADFALEKMTTRVLGNIMPVDRSVNTELANLIQSNVEKEPSPSESGQTVFIIGSSGAGKSTFLERFFRKTLPLSTRKKCVLIRVNCLDTTGREDTLLDWVTEKIITILESELYSNGAPIWDELMGLYHGEYLKRLNGVDSELYKSDKNAFKIKFGEYLSEKVEQDREGYLQRILLDIVNNRLMLPIFLVDNTDEFPNSYKESIFQYIQSLRRHIKHCLVLFPVTDKSAWSFSRTDIYGIYKSRSFFLPTPSPKDVFSKRINFLKMRLKGGGKGIERQNKYFTSRGIKISITNLDAFAQVLEKVFVDSDYTSKTIGELTNYNIRRTLLLSQRVITSSVIKIEDLIKSFVNGKLLTTSFSRFMEALLKGDYEVYKQGDNHEIYPIFRVNNEIKQSPLLNTRVLSLLDSINNSSRSIEEKHLNVEAITNYFVAIGCSESAIERTLFSLLESGLIEAFDLSNKSLSVDQKFAISSRGTAHLRLASHNSVFFYQMALTTAITNEETALKIRTHYYSKEPFQEKLTGIKTLFLDYLCEEDAKQISIDVQSEQYECQQILINDLKKFAHIATSDDSNLIVILGDEYKHGVIKKGVLATVDWYDAGKGYGFALVDGFSSGIFIQAKKLKEHGINEISDGDDLLCDIARNEKGVFIDKIHDIEQDDSNAEVVNCKIARLFNDRYYGFVNIEDSDRDALFHFSIFPEDDRKNLAVGHCFKAEIGAGKKDHGFQVKKLVSK